MDRPTETVTDFSWSSDGSTGREPPVFLAEEIVAGRFRILRALGVGGMGQVFEAEDLELGTPIALKVIRPRPIDDEEAEALLRREVNLARQVTHPNVCRIFDLVVHHPTDGSAAWGKVRRPILALSMELLEGETLAERIECRGSLPWDEALELLHQLAAALDAAHGAGVRHCDFKASNVMLTPTRAVVTDFGLARSAWMEGGGPDTSLRGTPAYLAPEVFAGGAPTEAADRYALGVVAYQMLTGSLPPGSERLSPTATRREKAPRQTDSPHRDLPPALAAVLSRALDRDPDERYPCAAAMVSALERIRGAAGERRRRRRRVAAISLPVLTLLFFLFALGWRPSPGGDQPPAEAHLEAARQALKAVDYPRGRAAAARAAVTARVTGSTGLEAEAHLLAAEAFEAMGEVARADEAMAEARRILEASGDRCALARASLVFRDSWDQERSPLPLAELPDLLAACGDPVHQAIALARLAKRHMETSLPEGETILRRAQSLAEESGDARALAEVWNVVGSLEYGFEDLAASEAAFSRAVAEARREGDPYLVAGSLCNQSWILGWLGRHKEEEETLREAASLARRIGNRYLLTRILQTEAKHHERRGDSAGAAATLEEAHRLALELGDSVLIALTLERLASFHERRGQWDEAIVVRQRVLSVRPDDGGNAAADRDRLALARLFLKVDRVDEAEALVSDVMARYPLQPDEDSTAIYSRFHRALVYLGRGELEPAAALFLRILPHLVHKEEAGLRRDAARLAVDLDRRLASSRCEDAWVRLAAQSPVVAGASPEETDDALRLLLDLGRLRWFQGDQAGSERRLEAVARQARAHGREAVAKQIPDEIHALERWSDFWQW